MAERIENIVYYRNNLRRDSSSSKKRRLEKELNLKFRHAVFVHICWIKRVPTLIYERGLEKSLPAAYHHIESFAGTEGLVLVEDRRSAGLNRRVLTDALTAQSERGLNGKRQQQQLQTWHCQAGVNKR